MYILLVLWKSLVGYRVTGDVITPYLVALLSLLSRHNSKLRDPAKASHAKYGANINAENILDNSLQFDPF